MNDPTVQELREALEDACDVAIWLTGATDLSGVEGWPNMRERLVRAVAVAHPEGVITDNEEPVGYVMGGSDVRLGWIDE